MPRQTATSTATALTAYEVSDAVVLKSPSSNTADVWFGYSNAVTAGSTPATDGMILSPGESYVIPPFRCGRTSGNIYIICAAGQSPVVYFEAK